MKLNLSRYFILLITAGAVVISCNKSSVKSTTSANAAALEAQQKQQAIQMGISLYKSISGQYGGVNISNSMLAASVQPKTNKISSYYEPLQCGKTAITPVDYSNTSGDTSFHTKGQDLFTYNCDTSGYTGYENNNQYYSTVKSGSTADSTNVNEDFTAIDENRNPYLESINGTMNTDQNFISSNQPPYSYFGKTETINMRDYSTAYTLTKVIVDNTTSSGLHVTGGVASFTSVITLMDKNNWPLGAYNSTGTITFEAYNDLALITAYYPYNQRTFTVTVNIVTGKVVVN